MHVLGIQALLDHYLLTVSYFRDRVSAMIDLFYLKLLVFHVRSLGELLLDEVFLLLFACICRHFGVDEDLPHLEHAWVLAHR